MPLLPTHPHVPTATNVANYIMYEDTNNQCTSKLDTAIMMFENLSTSGRNTFMTSSDYVIATARERLEAWALNQNKTIDHVNGDYVINAQINDINRNNCIILIIVITSIVSLSAASLFLMNTRKKKLNRR